MSDPLRPRGLGRGLASLLGEALMPEPAPTPNRPAAQPPGETPSPVGFEPVAVAPPAPSIAPGGFTPTPIPAPESPQAAPPLSASITPFPVTPLVVPPAGPPPQAANEPPRSGSRFIPLALIQRNPHQPRKHFDETELAELADSVRARGILQPILVRPIHEGGEERYEIVAGERRWRAAQRAGLHEIPAVIRELDDVEILEIGIIENVQRADLNPIEEAMGYQALIDRFGRTQQELAEVVGKSRPHIANTLRLLGLPHDVQEMVRDGRLTAGHARAILTAPNMMELAQLAITQGLNVREIERLAQQAKEARDGVRVRPAGAGAEKDADTRALEQRLGDALGLAVTISHKGEQGGAVTISYRTLEQLDDVIRRLGG